MLNCNCSELNYRDNCVYSTCDNLSNSSSTMSLSSSTIVLSLFFGSKKQLSTWCRYVIWIKVISLIILFMMLFLYQGNKLGATFLWIPQQFNNANCTISISEQTRFDYDYSLDESNRRNPACSPQEIEGSMPHCWDYRVRFTIASLISFL
eukprot:480798_1